MLVTGWRIYAFRWVWLNTRWCPSIWNAFPWSSLDGGREGELGWCEQLQDVLGCRNGWSADPHCSMQKHCPGIWYIHFSGMVLLYSMAFLCDFYCSCFICRCLDFCRSSSKWKLLFGSDRSFLVWKLFPVSVQRRGQQEGHESHEFSQDIMMGPGKRG